MLFNEVLYRRIFTKETADKLIKRERRQHAEKSVAKQLLIKRLPVPLCIQNHISEYAFRTPSYAARHNKLMRKIVYIFKNSYDTRKLYSSEPTQGFRCGFNGYSRKICLSRKCPSALNPTDLPPLLKLGDYKRNHFAHNRGKYSLLKERLFDATNCARCGHFLWKKMAEHYREFDDPKKEEKWYTFLRKQNLGPYRTPYHDRLWCKCKKEDQQAWWFGGIPIQMN